MGTQSYEAFGAAKQALDSHDPEILLEGPAGTGKSRAWLEQVHLLASRYAGSRLLVLRKTRRSLTESALVTWERDVLPWDHPSRKGPSRAGRHSYRYENGAEVIVGGMDLASKILSTEYDFIYVQEATELTEADWEILTTRLRNDRMPFQQIVGDCNPDRPHHWLNLRCHAGKTTRLVSRHQDNPMYWRDGQWTKLGRSYLAKLEALSGARRARLLEGRWAASEGLVYENWDPAVHLVDRFEVPADWPRIWVVDFGFTNPFVWQEWALDPDGRAYRVQEIYRSRRMVVDHAADIRRATRRSPKPEAVVCDHSAEGRAILEHELKCETKGAWKSVKEGTQFVQERLRVADDGKPRLLLMRDALLETDSELRSAGKPACSEEEVDGYVWQQDATKDAPVKKDDHGMDCWRYLCAYLQDREKPIRVARSFAGE